MQAAAVHANKAKLSEPASMPSQYKGLRYARASLLSAYTNENRGGHIYTVTAACRAERERWWICAGSSSADDFVVKVSMNGCSVWCRVAEADRDPAIHRRTATDDTGVTGRRRCVGSSTCAAFAV